MRSWPILLSLVLPVAQAENLRLATYNVENYGPAGRMTEAGYRTGYPKPETEKRALRLVICAIRADVLALQEMGDEPYLDELRRDLRSDGLDYPYAAFLQAADADRHLALLSRRPLRDIRRHADLGFGYLGGRETVKRGLLEAAVATPEGDLDIFVLHLKSHLTDRPADPESADRRAAEAMAVRDCILGRFPRPAGSRFLILGDCNDGAPSRTLRVLQRRGRTAVATVLPAMDPRGEIWTEFSRHLAAYSALDHILVSPGLSAGNGGTARIYDGPGVSAASDHRPVYVDLNLLPKP